MKSHRRNWFSRFHGGTHKCPRCGGLMHYSEPVGKNRTRFKYQCQNSSCRHTQYVGPSCDPNRGRR